jgi:hypothetical protein
LTAIDDRRVPEGIAAENTAAYDPETGYRQAPSVPSLQQRTVGKVIQNTGLFQFLENKEIREGTIVYNFTAAVQAAPIKAIAPCAGSRIKLIIFCSIVLAVEKILYVPAHYSPGRFCLMQGAPLHRKKQQNCNGTGNPWNHGSLLFP